MEFSTSSAGHGDLSLSWDMRRSKALDAFAAVACLVGLPAAIALVSVESPLPRAWSLMFATLYIPMAAPLCVKRWGVVVRIRMLMIVACIIAAMAMVNGGLVGHGRLALAVWPLWGVLQEHRIATDEPTAATTWMLQGIGQPLALPPVMVLLDRLRACHMRTLGAEQCVLPVEDDDCGGSANADGGRE